MTISEKIVLVIGIIGTLAGVAGVYVLYTFASVLWKWFNRS